MAYQRMTRRQRNARWAKAKKERVHTGMGLIYRALRFIGGRRLTALVVRRPWHIADLYVGGQFSHPIYAGHNPMRKRP